MAKLNETCSAVILNKLPKKLGDPGRFLIPCEFSGINTCNALADLGASINLMPYSVWKDRLLFPSLPNMHDVELADRSITTKPIVSAKNVPNAFLALDDDTTSPEVDPTYYDPDGDILILEAFLNNEPPTPIPNQGDCSPETQEEIKLCEAKQF
ncbi:reverse transcriptase domain-containing protein [Tanacetum coccineum]